ncbi:hypothetical protein ALC57_17380 [Trachymyrmex cornetzi]|uniref:Uncharacterized protein n=1 Tax=Trachymyrmex cornetzi TaxID=471704 RepID=A0A151ITT3_9HYME|nr:hypothetical protein ALC57_17380 [Trachymyrmex cornetzi]
MGGDRLNFLDVTVIRDNELIELGQQEDVPCTTPRSLQATVGSLKSKAKVCGEAPDSADAFYDAFSTNDLTSMGWSREVCFSTDNLTSVGWSWEVCFSTDDVISMDWSWEVCRLERVKEPASLLETLEEPFITAGVTS